MYNCKSLVYAWEPWEDPSSSPYSNLKSFFIHRNETFGCLSIYSKQSLMVLLLTWIVFHQIRSSPSPPWYRPLPVLEFCLKRKQQYFTIQDGEEVKYFLQIRSVKGVPLLAYPPPPTLHGKFSLKTKFPICPPPLLTYLPNQWSSISPLPNGRIRQSQTLEQLGHLSHTGRGTLLGTFANSLMIIIYKCIFLFTENPEYNWNISHTLVVTSWHFSTGSLLHRLSKTS